MRERTKEEQVKFLEDLMFGNSREIEDLPTNKLQELQDRIKVELDKRDSIKSELDKRDILSTKCPNTFKRILFRDRSTGKFYDAEGNEAEIDPDKFK